MSLNPYDPCACGSGKKLKFCCLNIADEMDRIVRLSTGNQPHVALQQLETLARKFPENPWVGTTRAIILLEQGEASTARDVLRALIEHQPDHEFVIVLLAAALFQADGFDAAKKAIHRAFQKSAKKYSPTAFVFTPLENWTVCRSWCVNRWTRCAAKVRRIPA